MRPPQFSRPWHGVPREQIGVDLEDALTSSDGVEI
jgi:hypothetical protein